jgi:hypothetical protein
MRKSGTLKFVLLKKFPVIQLIIDHTPSVETGNGAGFIISQIISTTHCVTKLYVAFEIYADHTQIKHHCKMTKLVYMAFAFI